MASVMSDQHARSSEAALATPVMGLRNAGKRFGGTVAIDDVSFDLLPARCSRCSARTALARAPASSCWPASTSRTRARSCSTAQPWMLHRRSTRSRRGIAVMHQHPGLFPRSLSVAENIFIGHMPTGRLGRLDRSADARRGTRACSTTVGLACRPERRWHGLRTSEQQLVEIARALSVDARVLIMDEPTAALSQREVERLFAVVADLRRTAWR